MKPSWKDAPNWANWLAMDSDGTWFWHEAMPEMHGDEWDSVDRVAYASTPMDWTHSLEGRA